MMNPAQQFLARTLNADGGWGYQAGGQSFTEPTALCAMALATARSDSPTPNGTGWLLESQRSDGGWGALRTDSESGWHTSVAVWALGVVGRARGGADVERAGARGTDWLLAHRSRSLPLPNPATRLQGRLTGWGWTADTFGWVIPTGLALLALNAGAASADTKVAVAEAVSLLNDRRCSAGGWNWGNPFLFGSALPPYATETGVATLGLLASGLDAGSPDVSGALDWLAANVDAATGVAATAWAVLALGCGGRDTSSLKARLRSAQTADGGWRASPHATALAMLALADAGRLLVRSR
jgi:hypothetical protein